MNSDTIAAQAAQAGFDNQYQVHPDGCWIWTGPTVSQGTGQIGRRPLRGMLAHRVSYQLHHGPIPANRHVTQTCGHKKCVNPQHLTAVPIPASGVRGSRHGRSRLTAPEVQQIRVMLETVTVTDTARTFNVAVRTITDIRDRRSWGWLP